MYAASTMARVTTTTLQAEVVQEVEQGWANPHYHRHHHAPDGARAHEAPVVSSCVSAPLLAWPVTRSCAAAAPLVMRLASTNATTLQG